MHVKITSTSQVAPPPDEVVAHMEAAASPDAEAGGASIVLTPASAHNVEAIRDKLIALGISEKDVADASAWARRPKE